MNAYFDLVRLPAALSTPGDALLGAGASGGLRPVRASGLALSSALLYMSGMALNDYADREVDSRERPGRPIPSGRIGATKALGIGAALMAAGVAAASVVDGRRGALRSSATAAAILAYDFVAKGTPAGPPIMASCRFLDVMSGATSVRAGLVPASIVAAHTMIITGVSAYEVSGGTAKVGKLSAAATAAITALTIGSGVKTLACGPKRCGAFNGAVLAGALALYATPSVRASRAAMRNPSPGALQKIVSTGVMGMIPLQGALLSAAGQGLLGAAVTALHPLGRTLAKRRSVT